jgi:hypothetical protein
MKTIIIQLTEEEAESLRMAGETRLETLDAAGMDDPVLVRVMKRIIQRAESVF